jgi:hypothetical protein
MHGLWITVICIVQGVQQTGRLFLFICGYFSVKESRMIKFTFKQILLSSTCKVFLHNLVAQVHIYIFSS